MTNTTDGLNFADRDTPFLIAEIGVNYYDIAKKENISIMDAAKKMIQEAVEAGVDAVKFQSYKAKTLASKNSPAYWDTEQESTRSQFELFKKFDKLEDEDYKELATFTHDLDSMFLSTPFDFEAVDYLDPIIPFFKIASADITNHPFLKHIASKGKPILLSTGASTLAEIQEAIDVIHSIDESIPIALLHCVLSYPAKPKDANLQMIEYLKKTLPDYVIGYSDHVPPDESMITLLNAFIKGAKIIEKHFTLDKTLPGNDHYHAMDPKDVRTFLRNIDLLLKTNGIYYKKPLPCEKESRLQARRSIVAKQNIGKNEIITRDVITFKRPGTGISPKWLDLILNKKANQDIQEDQILKWDYIC